MNVRSTLWSLPVLLLIVVTASSARDLKSDLQAAAALRDQADFAGAAHAYESVAAAHPNHPVAHFQLAYCVHAGGEFERAIELHRAAARFPQMRVAALYNLACALAMTGRGDEACDALLEAVNAGFAAADLARADPELAHIRELPRFEEVLSYIATPAQAALAFWVGEWDVYQVGAGVLNGHSVLESRLDGVVILEQWTPAEGTSGSRGESWNWFDASRGVWRQDWIDVGGSSLEFVGQRQGAGILFEGDAPGGVGRVLKHRMFIRPVPGPLERPDERRVRQTGADSTDGGMTWKTTFDLEYVPKGLPFRGPG